MEWLIRVFRCIVLLKWCFRFRLNCLNLVFFLIVVDLVWKFMLLNMLYISLFCLLVCVLCIMIWVLLLYCVVWCRLVLMEFLCMFLLSLEYSMFRLSWVLLLSLNCNVLVMFRCLILWLVCM